MCRRLIARRPRANGDLQDGSCNHGCSTDRNSIRLSAVGPRRSRWVLLAFRLPREPSTPRITVWRRLKRIGAVQLLDGLVALPLDNRNREQLEWIAQEIAEAGGDPTIWLGELGTAEQERELVGRMREAVAVDYRRLIADAQAGHAQPVGRRRRSLSRLRRELRRVRERDHFPPPEQELARQAVDALAAACSTRSTNTASAPSCSDVTHPELTVSSRDSRRVR